MNGYILESLPYENSNVRQEFSWQIEWHYILKCIHKHFMVAARERGTGAIFSLTSIIYLRKENYKVVNTY